MESDQHPSRYYPDWRQTWPEDKPPFTSPAGRPTPKWKGISLTAVRGREGAVNEAEATIRAMQRVMDMLGQQRERAREALRLEVSALMHQPVTFGRHECDDSPTGTHLFDAGDAGLTSCLICGLMDAPDK